MHLAATYVLKIHHHRLLPVDHKTIGTDITNNFLMSRPINESISGENPDRLWTILRKLLTKNLSFNNR